MEIGPFISHLLFENERVVLPNFGEFSTKYIPARFIPEKKKIEAPRKQIEFNPEVKQGEPTLAMYIGAVTGREVGEVEQKIESFVGALYSSIYDDGNTVKLDQIGNFSRGFQGEVYFEPDTSINYLSDTIGLEPVVSPPKKIKPKVAEIEPVEVPKSQEVVVQEPVNVAPVELESNTSVEQKVQVVPNDDEVFDTKTEEKRKRRLGWLWFLLGLLFVLLLAYFLWPTVSKIIQKEKPAAVKIVEPEPKPEPEPQPEPEPDPFDLKPFLPQRGEAAYFLVVGAFPTLELAEAKAKEMRDAGGIYARPFMMSDLGYHRVSYGYFYDLQEAETELAKVRELGYKDAYVLRHRPR